jgi:hypothetical protein
MRLLKGIKHLRKLAKPDLANSLRLQRPTKDRVAFFLSEAVDSRNSTNLKSDHGVYIKRFPKPSSCQSEYNPCFLDEDGMKGWCDEKQGQMWHGVFPFSHSSRWGLSFRCMGNQLFAPLELRPASAQNRDSGLTIPGKKRMHPNSIFLVVFFALALIPNDGLSFLFPHSFILTLTSTTTPPTVHDARAKSDDL